MKTYRDSNGRIHGRLLMVTGVAHVALSLMPGVFGEQFYQFASSVFFNVSSGAADFSFFGGSMKYEEFAAFWFFYAGPMMFLFGMSIDQLERLQGNVAASISSAFLVVSCIGAYMVPFSGMTFVLIPQGLFMFVRSRNMSKVAS
jgi:hypothetical protein